MAKKKSKWGISCSDTCKNCGHNRGNHEPTNYLGQGGNMKKVKNNKPPVFPRWKYVGDFRSGNLVRMATYKLIKVEG